MAMMIGIVTPVDKNFVPVPEALLEARGMLYDWFYPDDVYDQTWEVPHLVTKIDAFSSLKCPRCHAVVDEQVEPTGDDHHCWLAEFAWRMSESVAPEQELVRMPCCSAEVLAADIDYLGNAVFARTRIRVSDIECEDFKLTKEQRNELEAALGCTVQTMLGIWA